MKAPPLAAGSSTDAAYEHLPEINRPSFVIAEIEHVFSDALTNAPRSLQTRIGPSEIGEECTRALAHKLNGDIEPERQLATKAWVGTCMHAGIEEMVKAIDPSGAVWLTEQRVSVGEINGVEITGSCDLFNHHAGMVVDFKTKGKSTLSSHKRKGPGEKYRIQAHLYGRGWQRAGYVVNTVAFWFMGRDSEFSERCWWHEPYDEAVAITALERATTIAQLLDAIGLEQTLALYPECDDRWCAWCPQQRQFAATPHPPITDTASLFATA